MSYENPTPIENAIWEGLSEIYDVQEWGVQEILDALGRNGFKIVPALDAELWQKLVADNPHCEDGWGNVDDDLRGGIRLSRWIALKRGIDPDDLD